MDLYYPGAVWRGPTPNKGGQDVESRGLVVHIAEGTYEGTIAWQRNDASDVSSEFVVARDGRVAQMMPANVMAWTQQAGNGRWDAVECEGYSTGALTTAQIDAIAALFAWGHQVRGWPLQLATSPVGRGLGHHSMGTAGHSVPTDTWTGPTWGHEQCPGPQIVAQKPLILARAIQIVNGTPIQEDVMADFTDKDVNAWTQAVRVDGLANRQLPDALASLGRIEEKLAAPVPVTVDASAVAAALAGNAAFLGALAKAVNDDAASRLAQ